MYHSKQHAAAKVDWPGTQLGTVGGHSGGWHGLKRSDKKEMY